MIFQIGYLIVDILFFYAQRRPLRNNLHIAPIIVGIFLKSLYIYVFSGFVEWRLVLLFSKLIF